MKSDFAISFIIDLFVDNGDPGKINDLLIDFLNDLDDVKDFKVCIHRCLSVDSILKKEDE